MHLTVDQYDLVGNLERGEAVSTECSHPPAKIRARLATGQVNKSFHDLTGDGVIFRHDGRIDNPLHHLKNVFHLHGKDLLSAHVDHLRRPSEKPYVLPLDLDPVAGVQPAISVKGAGGVQVAQHG